MLVLKFGGTSVGNATMMDQTLSICLRELDAGPVLVSSAITKVTDALVHIANLASTGEQASLAPELEKLKQLHLNTAAQFLSGTDLSACNTDIEALFHELSSIVRGLSLIREVSPRSRDTLVSFGERLSTVILFHRARTLHDSVELLDARTFIKTDEAFTSANLLKHETYTLVRQKVNARPGHLIITQGFISSTLQGVTSTLGRGGSDYSATIIGAALNAKEVQIWTDVDGILTTDPRMVPNAKLIDEISYAEAAELSYFGAKVIHPSTILPAVELNIPVWVKNTKRPEIVGTRIFTHSARKGIQAIAGKKNVTLVTVHSTRMLNAYGFLRSIFQVFEEFKVSVDLVATSEVSVSVTIDDATHIKSLKRELEKFSRVEIEEKKAIICLVGRDLWKESDFISKAFAALKSVPVRMITLGGSDINLSLVVPQDFLEPAIKQLHEALFPED